MCVTSDHSPTFLFIPQNIPAHLALRSSGRPILVTAVLSPTCLIFRPSFTYFNQCCHTRLIIYLYDFHLNEFVGFYGYAFVKILWVLCDRTNQITLQLQQQQYRSKAAIVSHLSGTIISSCPYPFICIRTLPVVCMNTGSVNDQGIVVFAGGIYR